MVKKMAADEAEGEMNASEWMDDEIVYVSSH